MGCHEPGAEGGVFGYHDGSGEQKVSDQFSILDLAADGRKTGFPFHTLKRSLEGRPRLRDCDGMYKHLRKGDQ